jgi:hypothetical protein
MQAVNPAMNLIGPTTLVESSSQCGQCNNEVTAVLRSVAQSLSFSHMVKGVHIFEGAMGSSSALNVEPHSAEDAQAILALLKSTLLESAASSQSTYIVGYLATPFCAVGDSSFRCTIAKVPNGANACWDFYQKGFCPRPSSCRWCHPEGSDLMTVWVNLKL